MRVEGGWMIYHFYCGLKAQQISRLAHMVRTVYQAE
jgi:hypothetical protein